ncbi:MAG: molybdopterin-dependent oxidoreductase [Dehalococcoidales bacterium]|nr:molybdopterin-dependent oxidoreductase [Dehalococcoidales bacterium]
MIEKAKPGMATGKMKSFLKGLGFMSSSSGDGNSSVVDVKNGRILRIRPLYYNWKYDTDQFNPWEMRARGSVFKPMMKTLAPPYSLAYKKRVYSPNRILYPLKRSDWDPAGERNPGNRGKSGYVRISWDEALEIVASEIKRVKEEYGSYSILSQSDGHGETKVIHGTHGCQNNLLSLLGGSTTQIRNADSWEGWYWGAKHVWGMEPVGQQDPVTNVIPDIAQHTDMVLFWGCDPETTPWGFDGQMASRVCYWWTELGIKSVYICPELNYGAAVHADKWIPILPGTDAALHLALAYVWMKEGTYDKEYVATHTFGFEKFEEYVLGKEDGVPKTPAWAAEKTSIAEWTIKALAREWAATKTTIAHGNGGPGIRGPYATENGRLEILLLAMQGIGKPGIHQVKMLEWGRRCSDRLDPMPLGKIRPNVFSVYTGAMKFAAVKNQKEEKDASPQARKGADVPRQFIPKNLIHDALLHPPISWYGTTSAVTPLENQFVKYTYPAEGCPEIHMIWTDTPCWITCWNDTNTYIKALRSPKIEFIIAQHPWLENDCLFADIILPVNTKFEEQDIAEDNMNGQFHVILHESKCIEPIGESKSDYEIVCMIAERLGLLKEYTEGKTVEELQRQGFENSGAQELVSYEEFTQKGYFVIPTDPDWKNYPAGLAGFYKDPENNPLKTPSGKIEFYAQNLAKYFPDDQERPPVPHWIEKGESHDERLSSERAKKYPLLLMSNHGRWRVHANHDDITWTREIPTCKVTGPDGYKYEPLWLNPADAARANIEHGDVVKIYNERGAVLGGAYITERMMPGVVYMDHGARYDPIVPGELDRGGAINTITPHNRTSKNATGMVVSGFLVGIEKADLDDLRRKYPEAFTRQYHPGSGLRFERALVKNSLFIK